MCSERGMLVWSPSMLGDEEMDKYVHTAFDKYGYNREQAHYKNVAQNCVLSYNDIVSVVSRIL